MSVLQEILATEATYVSDLRVLCEIRARLSAHLTPDSITAIFANVQTLLGVNEELLFGLRGKAEANGSTITAAHVAQAFTALAPFLRSYAEFCTKGSTSQELLRALRKMDPAVEEAVCEVEQTTGQPMGSWLIKPVQRLCKYPLLLKTLLQETPQSGPDYAPLRHAFDAIQNAVTGVNDRVRAAEEREGLLLLAEALGRKDLMVPHRTLLLSVNVAKFAENHEPSGKGLGQEVGRLISMSRSTHKALLWLCNDTLLLGRIRGAAFTLVEKTAIANTSLKAIDLSQDCPEYLRLPSMGEEPEDEKEEEAYNHSFTASEPLFDDTVVRLTCEGGTHYLLCLERNEATKLLHAFADAREKVTEQMQVRAKGALGALQELYTNSSCTPRAAEGGEQPLSAARKMEALRELKAAREDRKGRGEESTDQLHTARTDCTAASSTDVRKRSSSFEMLRRRLSAAAVAAANVMLSPRRGSLDNGQLAGMYDSQERRARTPSLGNTDISAGTFGVRHGSPSEHGATSPSLETPMQSVGQSSGYETPTKSMLDRLDRHVTPPKPAAFDLPPPQQQGVLRDLIQAAERNGDFYLEPLLAAIARRTGVPTPEAAGAHPDDEQDVEELAPSDSETEY